MNYCLLENFELELMSQGEKLIEYYNDNIEKIANILGVDKSNIPKGITILLLEGEGALYSKDKKIITYRYKNKDNILEDKGRLIHEATHVVQDYPESIGRGHPCWCWMEGIADYCRAQIDKDFNLEEGLEGKPLEKGYKDNAHFLSWLSSKYGNKNIIQKLNKIIFVDPNNFLNPLEVLEKLINEPPLDKLINESPINLLKKYYEENKDKFLTNCSTECGYR